MSADVFAPLRELAFAAALDDKWSPVYATAEHAALISRLLREHAERGAYCGAIANLGPIGGTLRCGKSPHARHVMHYDADRLVIFDDTAVSRSLSSSPHPTDNQ